MINRRLSAVVTTMTMLSVMWCTTPAMAANNDNAVQDYVVDQELHRYNMIDMADANAITSLASKYGIRMSDPGGTITVNVRNALTHKPVDGVRVLLVSDLTPAKQSDQTPRVMIDMGDSVNGQVQTTAARMIRQRGGHVDVAQLPDGFLARDAKGMTSTSVDKIPDDTPITPLAGLSSTTWGDLKTELSQDRINDLVMQYTSTADKTARLTINYWTPLRQSAVDGHQATYGVKGITASKSAKTEDKTAKVSISYQADSYVGPDYHPVIISDSYGNGDVNGVVIRQSLKDKDITVTVDVLPGVLPPQNDKMSVIVFFAGLGVLALVGIPIIMVVRRRRANVICVDAYRDRVLCRSRCRGNRVDIKQAYRRANRDPMSIIVRLTPELTQRLAGQQLTLTYTTGKAYRYTMPTIPDTYGHAFRLSDATGHVLGRIPK